MDETEGGKSETIITFEPFLVLLILVSSVFTLSLPIAFASIYKYFSSSLSIELVSLTNEMLKNSTYVNVNPKNPLDLLGETVVEKIVSDFSWYFKLADILIVLLLLYLLGTIIASNVFARISIKVAITKLMLYAVFVVFFVPVLKWLVETLPLLFPFVQVLLKNTVVLRLVYENLSGFVTLMMALDFGLASISYYLKPEEEI